MDDITQIQAAIQAFEKAHAGGYIYIEFCSSAFTWGYIRFRRACSGGPDGEAMFRNRAEAFEVINKILPASARVAPV